MANLRVLVVDDESDFLETIVKRLERRQIDAAGVDNGRKALDLLENESFDIVILDFKMPEMNGIEALEAIKKVDPAVEVIMLTGHASVDVAVEIMKLGGYDYFLKPCPLEELTAKIDAAHERKKAREGRLRKTGTPVSG